MTAHRLRNILRVLAAPVMAGVLSLPPASAETLADISGHTHYHGLAYSPAGDASTLLIATHHGIFAVKPDGEAQRLSPVHDFMGFTTDPSDPGRLLGSGHPTQGGNSGFLESRDGGATWVKVSDGVGGPVDFHALTVSRADPRFLYGAYRGIQMSDDGGASWQVTGRMPQKLVGLAASARKPGRIFAATAGGLLVSEDRGASFQAAGFPGETVSAVAVDPQGDIHAFVLGRGLMRASEDDLSDWQTLNTAFGESVPLHLAFHPAEKGRMALATQANEVFESLDGGKTWGMFGK